MVGDVITVQTQDHSLGIDLTCDIGSKSCDMDPDFGMDTFQGLCHDTTA